MTNVLNTHVDFDLRMLRIGGVMAGAGILLASAGTALIGVAVTKAARDWIGQLERSPSEMASERLQQARFASNAAMQAWRQGRPVNGSAMSR